VRGGGWALKERVATAMCGSVEKHEAWVFRRGQRRPVALPYFFPARLTLGCRPGAVVEEGRGCETLRQA
jgi:hypothetical protein